MDDTRQDTRTEAEIKYSWRRKLGRWALNIFYFVYQHRFDEPVTAEHFVDVVEIWMVRFKLAWTIMMSESEEMRFPKSMHCSVAH